MKTKFKVLIAFLVAALLVLIYSGVLLLSDSKPKLSSNVSNDTIYNIIHTKSNELTLENGDMNSLVKLLLKNKAIKGTEVLMQNSSITFNIYCNYKKINFLLSAKGSLKSSENQLIFTPDWFKIGRLTVPKDIAFYFMKKYSNDYIKFLNGGKIALSTDILQIKISALSIVDGKMHISLAKAILEGNPKIAASQNNNSTTSSKPYVYNNSNSNNTISNNNSNSKTSSNENISKDTEANNVTENNIQNKQKDSTVQLLQSVSSQLSDAIARASNANERNILCKIQSSINSKLSNPEYNFSKDATDVNHDYASLTVSERKNLQFIILGTVDIQSLNKLKSIFGASIP